MSVSERDNGDSVSKQKAVLSLNGIVIIQIDLDAVFLHALCTEQNCILAQPFHDEDAGAIHCSFAGAVDQLRGSTVLSFDRRRQLSIGRLPLPISTIFKALSSAIHISDLVPVGLGSVTS